MAGCAAYLTEGVTNWVQEKEGRRQTRREGLVDLASGVEGYSLIREPKVLQAARAWDGTEGVLEKSKVGFQSFDEEAGETTTSRRYYMCAGKTGRRR